MKINTLFSGTFFLFQYDFIQKSPFLVENAWEHRMFTTMQKKGQLIWKHSWIYSIFKCLSGWTKCRGECRIPARHWSSRTEDNICNRPGGRPCHAEIAKEMQRFAGYPPAVNSMSQETTHEIIEGNDLPKLQEADEVWREVIQWVTEGRVPKSSEVSGTVQKALTVRQ